MSSLSKARDARARALGEATAGPAPAPDDDSTGIAQPWITWPMSILERLPLPYWILVILAGASAIGEQVIELILQAPSLAQLGALVRGSIVFPLLVVYILTHLRILKNAAIDALTDLRPSVRVSDEVYETYAHRLVRANPWVEVVLLGVSLGVVLLLFLGLDAELLTYVGGLPPSPLVALFVIFNYTLLGWLILSLVYCSLRQAAALRGLAHLPLEINVLI